MQKRKRSYGPSTMRGTKFRRADLNQPFRQPRMAMRTVRKQYVARTPGGQIVSDNHYFDTERTVTTIPQSASTWSGAAMDPNTSAMLCLFAPTIGDDISNRTGRKVFVKKIYIKGVIQVNAQTAQTAQDEAANVRVICFQDKQTNAAQATGDLVILQGAGSDAISMGASAVNFGRFRILKDKRFTFDAPVYSGLTTAFVAPGMIQNFKWSIKVNQWVNFNATNGGTVADIVDNSFHVIALGNVSSLSPSISYKVRTVFLP